MADVDLTPQNNVLAHAVGHRIADRYLVRGVLGRGGMAAVYRVIDETTHGELALKQLFVLDSACQRTTFESLFEREYHTLKQLTHPSMIAVYEYGLPLADGAYYTMELLDGGDLRERAPVPWRELCRLMFDICSSLALLHSRRLIHRDISPRNIRCTTHGTAKLIDFGALSTMGPGGGALVGTPAFAAPEMVQRSAVDARTDLFSLGTTFYYALTRHSAFAARTFPEALAAWDTKPPPPSSFVPDVPAALDDLVMSLLHVEPALRPQSAFEVMQRLAAIAELPRSEPEGVSRAYLATPTLVGRDEVLGRLRVLLGRSQYRRGGGVLVRAAAGLGRSRTLDAMALEAKTLGVTVLRATPNAAQQPFSTALRLAECALEALPPWVVDPALAAACGSAPSGAPSERVQRSMSEFAAPAHDPPALQRRLCDFLIGLTQALPLLLAVDDVHLIDEPSAALLSELIERAHRKRLLVATTALAEEGDVRALATLARRSEVIELGPLDREQSRALLASMFGDVPNLTLLANELFDVARGNPRQISDVAQHMLDKGVISYTAGVWALPQTLSAADMPSSAEVAIAARIANLSPTARSLGEAHALSFQETLTRDDHYALHPGVASRTVDEAVMELERNQALNGDGQTFALASRIWSAAFRASLTDETATQHHRALAELYRDQSPLAMIHHMFCAGLDESALDSLLEHLRDLESQLNVHDSVRMRAAQLRPSYLRALRAAELLGRPERQKHDLRRWLVTLSVISDPACYWEGAPQWLERLKLDSGWTDWEADPDRSDPGLRLHRALQSAHQRYLETPETRRVYRFDEAIRYLTEFVGISIAIAARVHDFALMRGLPALLEPFAPLSPVTGAIWQNAIAGSDSYRGRYYQAHARWKQVHASLSEVAPAELQHADVIRNAVAFGVGLFEAFMGFPTAERWAEQLDGDPLQHLSALSIRKVVCLSQGDWHGADRIRREIEVLTLQARAPQMFNALLSVELNAYAAGRDLTGLREMLAQLRPLAERYSGWQADLHLGEARFEFLRGDLAAAKREFERCLEVIGDLQDGAPANIPAWIAAQAGLVELLLASGHAPEALARARDASATMQSLEMDADDLTHAYALADARCGDFASANARLDEMIAVQVARGITGLRLGLSYEARAQVAIWAGDEEAFAKYALQTAREYRHGAGSPLGTRYERLMSQAQRQSFAQSFMVGLFQNVAHQDAIHATAIVAQALVGAGDATELARRALRLICSIRDAGDGHLYILRDEEPTLVASLGTSEAPSVLVDQIRAYVRRERVEDDLATVVETGDTPVTAQVTACAEANGRMYRLIPLNVGRADEISVVAVAAVEEKVGPPAAPSTSRVLQAIATKLEAAYEVSET